MDRRLRTQNLLAALGVGFALALGATAHAQQRIAGQAAETDSDQATFAARNYGAIEGPEPFRNANGDFSYLSISQTYYGGWAGYPYWYGGYYGYGPWVYGPRYVYPYRHYPYAFGYGYGWAGYGPNLYYGSAWPRYAGYPWRYAPYSPGYPTYLGRPGYYGSGPGTFYSGAGGYYW